MNLFRKLAVSVHSQVEAMTDRFENKEALSTAYIREYERGVAKAKVRLTQVEGEVARLEKEAGRLHEQTKLWADRARLVHAEDENKALDCIARMTQSQGCHRRVQAELEETERLRQQMTRDVDQILKKLEALRRKHQNLACRQACAEAAGALQDGDVGIDRNVDELFARWETDVVARELHSRSPAVASDPLAEEFAADEQKRDLRLALERLLATPIPEEEKKP